MSLSSDISTTSTALSDIKQAIIAKGVTPSGNITTYAAAISSIPSGGSKYGANGDTFLGDVNASGVLQLPTEQSDLVFTGVTDVASYGLSYKFSSSKVKSVSFSNLTTLSGYGACQSMFSDCTALTSVSLPNLTTISGSYACQSMFSHCTALTSVSLPNLTMISGSYACQYMFYNCTALTSVSLPNLTTISVNSGCYNMFYNCTALTSLSFPELTTISGSSACYNMFYNCRNITDVYFPRLTTISGSAACQYMFYNGKNITDVYFPALTTSSFGSYTNQFNYMMNATGSSKTHTLHFPSNMESTISGLQGYPNFGGTSGYVVLAFDLPATS